MKDCIFCKIINKEIPAYIIAENDHAIAFLDVNPISEGHTLVIPKVHCCDLATCPPEHLSGVILLAQHVAKVIERSKKTDAWGINYLSNQGKIAGQVVNHFHLHIIPKYAVNEGFEFKCENIFVQTPPKVLQENFLKVQKKMLKDKFNK